MQGKIVKVEKTYEMDALLDVGNGYILTIEIEAPCIEEPRTVRDAARDWKRRTEEKKEREDWYNSEDYKKQLKAIENFESSLALGRVEIKYLDKK